MRLSRIIAVGLAAAALALPAAAARAQATGAGKTGPQTMPLQKALAKATAHCNDGTWSAVATEKRACLAHGGVAKWFGKRPKDATARCNDGEYWTGTEREGACADHGGVALWYKKPKKST